MRTVIAVAAIARSVEMTMEAAIGSKPGAVLHDAHACGHKEQRKVREKNVNHRQRLLQKVVLDHQRKKKKQHAHHGAGNGQSRDGHDGRARKLKE